MTNLIKELIEASTRPDSAVCTAHDHVSDLEFLKRAREVYSDHGGARGTLVTTTGDALTVCAMGAMNEACTTTGYYPYDDRKHHVIELLDDIAARTYDHVGFVSVNDLEGKEATLHVFDLAIKELSNANDQG